MKKIFTKIFLVVMILTVVGVVIVPQESFAAGWLEGPAMSVVNSAISIVANWFLGLTSWLVTISGIFLSISVNLTTHTGDFFNSIPALKDVWLVVRNISSMIIIFLLIYTSITTILGASSSNVKALIGKIIMAGLLINFSLVFAKMLIDASNLVSLQFYRAIAPQSQVTGLSKVSTAFYDGGLSNVFMYSLKIPKIYENKGALRSTDVAVGISFATVGGMLMMVTAALSFSAAAFAFVIRTAILLFVMALSPLYFAAMIFPQVKGKADELLNLFKGQLLFMPAYLFLMYIALKLISSDGFSAIFNQNATGIAKSDEGTFGPVFIGVIVQYVIALVFINAPLIMAIKLGAVGAKWAPTNMGIGLAKKFGSFAGRNTVGRASKGLGGLVDSMDTSNSRIVKGASAVLGAVGITKAVRGGLTNAEKGKYGSQSLEDVKKDDKDRNKQLRGLNKIRDLDLAIAHAESTKKSTGTADTTKIKAVLASMSNSEIAALDTKRHLTNEHVLPLLSSSVHSIIEKGDNDKDKIALKTARYKKLITAVKSSNSAEINAIMKNMSGDDLQKFIEETVDPTRPPPDPTNPPPFDRVPIPLIGHMRVSQLKDMDGLADARRKEIGDSIRYWHTTHAAHKFITIDNKEAWLTNPTP